jgi:hemolysin activation/secretion protein
VDPLAGSETTANRIRLGLSAALFPALFDAELGFGKVTADVSALLAPSPSPRVALALRAGGAEVWGRLPWHQAAFLGGTGSLNGWDEQRFAGDVAVSGGAELRVRLWRPRVVLPTSLGVFGFADAGRVYLDGASPGGWHTSTGGGLWLQPVQQPYMVRLGVGVGAEATKVFVTLGLPY